MDAKRGDIGSTAARQAVALFDGLGADAVTVSPYLGEEAIAPLLERLDRFAYVLCRTSNPGAGELQGLVVAGRRRRRRARRSRSRPASPGASLAGDPGGTVGLVVGATAPAELAAIRAIAPGLAFLVPGVGAQGGDVERGPRGRAGDGAPAGGRPAAACSSTSRAGSPGGRPGAGAAAPSDPASASRRPPGLGRATACATLASRADGRPPPRALVAHEVETMPSCRTSGPRAHHHPHHRPAVLGPGKLPDVGAGARQEHPRVPQGLVGHPEATRIEPSTRRRRRRRRPRRQPRPRRAGRPRPPPTLDHAARPRSARRRRRPRPTTSRRPAGLDRRSSTLMADADAVRGAGAARRLQTPPSRRVRPARRARRAVDDPRRSPRPSSGPGSSGRSSAIAVGAVVGFALGTVDPPILVEPLPRRPAAAAQSSARATRSRSRSGSRSSSGSSSRCRSCCTSCGRSSRPA